MKNHSRFLISLKIDPNKNVSVQWLARSVGTDGEVNKSIPDNFFLIVSYFSGDFIDDLKHGNFLPIQLPMIDTGKLFFYLRICKSFLKSKLVCRLVSFASI